MSQTISDELRSLTIERTPQRTQPRARSERRVGVWLWRGAAAIALLGLLAAGASVRDHIPWPMTPREVQLAAVLAFEPHQAEVLLTATGRVRATRHARVASRVPGRVAAVHVSEGADVRQGQVLLELEPSDRLAALRTAEVAVAAAAARESEVEAELRDARAQAERAARLVEQGATARAGADDLASKANVLGAKLQVARAQKRVAVAQSQELRGQLSDLKLRAPIDGRCITEPPRLGEVLDPSVPGSALQIADFAALRLEADVPEGRLHMLRAGIPAEIVLDAYPKRPVRAEVAKIGSSVDRAKATVGVELKFLDEIPGVLPEMSARVSFLAKPIAPGDQQERKLLLPRAALTERGGSHVVFEFVDGVAQQRSVTVAERAGSSDRVELIDGPRAGTKLVLNPSAELKDGEPVKEKTND